MNKRGLVVLGIAVAVVLFVLLFTERIHVAIGSILLLVDLVVVYSYTTKKNQELPEEFHDSFEDAFEMEKPEADFLENKTKICLVCHTENNIHRKYCKKCNNLIQNITCPVCGTNNPHTAKYCSQCDSILQNKTRS